MAGKRQTLGRKLGKFAALVLALPVLILVLPLALVAITLHLLHRLALYLLVWALWLPNGRNVLVVLSDSPVWRDYMWGEIVPLVRGRAVVLNWSERKKWARWSFAPHVFRAFGGRRDFNPLVVVFRPLRRAEVLRFWQAFKDWKHGNTEPVGRLKQRLAAALW